MPFAEELDAKFKGIQASQTGAEELMNRFKVEVEFAKRFAAHRKSEEWNNLILKAVEHVDSKLAAGGAIDLKAVISEAEEIMAPIGKAAKEYTIHCAGHAHIDMNWMWPWPETVSCAHDTFTTVNRLMEEYPTFHFSQSQASTYVAMEEYVPEIFDMIKKRIAEGRWEPTASMWVEGDKNMASGDILARHLLYTRRYFKEKFGLPYDAIKIDWEPDTFGHCHTLPSILAKGGVKWYYFCRAGKKPQLFWWQAPDGSRVLAFQDLGWYNGKIIPDMTNRVFLFEEETGLKEYLWLYGVGDHGGGPTRKDLNAALDMNTWPIYPNIKLSTMKEFFSTIEPKVPADLPVIDDELNFVFPGCYTSESNVKRGNRDSENWLPETEMVALIAGAVADMPYPTEDLRRGWRHAMFNQFHDILPGSGVKATYDYAQGLYQESRR
jgi:alpha-mannosidase